MELLYSTGNYSQYPVITYNGKESEKEYIYIFIHNCIILLYTRNTVNQLYFKKYIYIYIERERERERENNKKSSKKEGIAVQSDKCWGRNDYGSYGHVTQVLRKEEGRRSTRLLEEVTDKIKLTEGGKIVPVRGNRMYKSPDV